MKKRVLTVLLVLLVVVGAIFAVNAADAQDKLELTLHAHRTTPLSISQDAILDLNGYYVTANITVADGANLYIKDSSNGNGKITGTITGNFMSVKNYVPLKINGAYSFRNGDFALENAAYLRTKDIYSEGASIYFKGNIGADNDVIAKNVAAHGVAMRLADGEYFADGKAGGETFTSYTGWISSDDNEINKLNSVELTGIMRRGNSAAINNRNAEYVVYCAPYVEMANGERLLGEEIRCSLKQLIEQVNAGWDEADWVTYDHKAAMVTFNQAFPGVLPKWNTIGRINSLIDPAANTQENPFSIQDADDLVLASKASVKNFRLDKDIDMSTVKDWKPFTTFSGTFNGNDKKISNLTITGSSYATSVGFIGINNGTVTNLHLRDVEVVVPSNALATAVGTIAGTNNGSVTGVTAAGSVTDPRAGSAAAQIYAGAIVGKNNGTVTVGNTVTVSTVMEKSLDANGNVVESKRQTIATSGIVNVIESEHTTTGLSADVGLFMNEDSEYVHRGLIGTGSAVSNAASVYWRDRSYSTERQATELQRRRLVVEDDVFQQATIKWTPSTTIKYWNNKTKAPAMEKGTVEKVWVTIYGSFGYWKEVTVGYHIHNQTYNAGQVYYGIPYTHCAAPMDQAMYYLSEGSNGVYTLKSEVTQIKGGPDSAAGESTWNDGDIGWGSYFGSDCSGGITSAWHKVSPILTSEKKNNGVCLLYTNNMVPSQYNQWYYGFRQVGDYEVNDKEWTTWDVVGADVTAGGVTMNDYVVTTEDIFQKIGKTGFYEAYAKSQMGDMVVAFEKESSKAESADVGHARLIAEDPVVIRNGNNVIDGVKSYFLFHEQGAGLYDTPNLSSWRANWKCSFEEAALCINGQTYGGNGNGRYMPITMPAFHDTEVAATGGIANGGNVLNGNNPLKYALNSSYRIMSATMIIKDEQGNTVYEATRFQGTSSSQNRRRAVPGYIPLFANDVFSDCCDKLVDGQTYYVTFSGTTYGGVTNVKMNNYKIVYDPAA